jgi:hypothetical protein
MLDASCPVMVQGSSRPSDIAGLGGTIEDRPVSDLETGDQADLRDHPELCLAMCENDLMWL